MSRKLTRREMMAYSVGTVAGLTLTSSCSQSLKQSCGRGFKLGVCDWTIGMKTNPASLATAKRLGLDGVQVDYIANALTRTVQLTPYIECGCRTGAARAGDAWSSPLLSEAVGAATWAAWS